MRKTLLLLSLLSLSTITWSCSDNEDNTTSTPVAVSVQKSADMADFEASFARNAQKLDKGEITQVELEQLTVATAKKYLSDNKVIIKEDATDAEIVMQALALNLERIQKSSSN